MEGRAIRNGSGWCVVILGLEEEKIAWGPVPIEIMVTRGAKE